MANPKSIPADHRPTSRLELFSFGFRPFFLCAGVWPALIAPMWVMGYLGVPPFADALTRDWHVHEMLFGYMASVMAGFLLTAVPNWTGRPPLVGRPLVLLVLLWLAGRIAMLLGPTTWLGSLIDSAYLVVLAALVWREVLSAGNRRNLPVCVLLSLLATANIGTHLHLVAPDLALAAERLALGATAMMITVIGGRVTPSFTRNWLMPKKVQRLPAPESRFDNGVLAVTGLALAAWIDQPQSLLTGIALIVAGALNIIRMSRWRGLQTAAEPLLLVLHLGDAWLATALLLMGTSAALPDLVPRSAADHALTVGAIGVMTLAMMTRAILGHTGRRRHAGPATVIIYGLANLAAVVRVSASFFPQSQSLLLPLAAAAWSLAFGGFVLVYGPMLVTPRISGWGEPS